MRRLWLAVAAVVAVTPASAQEAASEGTCYGAGSMAAGVILSIICTAALAAVLYWWWIKRNKNKEHLILETDPEKGKAAFAFDNPGFKDAGYTPASKTSDKNNKLDSSKSNKWSQWSALSALTTKSEKRKTLDDSTIDGNVVKVVALRSQDFTGLGFNICGNMKEGIYIKDVLHHGPAFESGKLNPGDRINSVTISFEHMVYEDALTILSYASPYEVIIEAKGGKYIHNNGGQAARQLSHPIYRSSSYADLYQGDKPAKKCLFGEEYNSSMSSNYSSLQKSRSNVTTLERKESKSPQVTQPGVKKPAPKVQMSADQLKQQLEQKIIPDHQHNLKIKNEKPLRAEAGIQKTENSYQKFGIRVLPAEHQQKSPKSTELSQNDNNINIERLAPGIDEVDKKSLPQAKKREKKTPPERPDDFERGNDLNNSGIKRDENGIPQEIPSHMLNAAVAARKNRKNSDDRTILNDEDHDSSKPRKKAKAPPPPEERKNSDQSRKDSFNEIKIVSDNRTESTDKKVPDKEVSEDLDCDSSLLSKENYNSDSDIETDNQSSVNTIELNSSEITIHHSEDIDDRRRTASTGDLTKMHRGRKTSSGTLERAQSLDITDTGIPSLSKRATGRFEDTFDIKSDEELFGKAMMNKEPRLSLILDGLNTFQRNRLKKSTEWGNLEDAMLKLNHDEDNKSFDSNITIEDLRIDAPDRSPELSAVVDKIKEIKRQSLEIPADEIVSSVEKSNVRRPKNQIWPSDNDIVDVIHINTKRQIIRKPEDCVPFPKELEIETSTDSSKLSNEITTTPVPVPMQKTFILMGNNANANNDFSGQKRQHEDEYSMIPEKKERYSLEQPVSHIELQSSPDDTLLTAPKVENVIVDEVENINAPLTTLLTAPVVENVSLNDDLSNDHIKLNKTSLNGDNDDDDKEEQNVTVTNGNINEITTKSPVQTVSSGLDLEDKPDELESFEISKNPVNSGEFNDTDEAKTSITKINAKPIDPSTFDITSNFLYNEKFVSGQDSYNLIKGDTNIPDDVKVSRNSLESAEKMKQPKYEIKNQIELNRNNNISNVTISNDNSLISEYNSFDNTNTNTNTESSKVEDTKTDSSELYTTALDTTKENKNDLSKLTITTPDLIKNVSIIEAINSLNNDVTLQGPNSLTLDISGDKTESPERSTVSSTIKKFNSEESKLPKRIVSPDKTNNSLTYITEIQVTPVNKNVSEVEVSPNSTTTMGNENNLDKNFENYVKNFESNVKSFETNIKAFETNIEKSVKKEPETPNENINAEKELHKIQEIAEEQLKKLPEMRFTTSSYEASRVPEKRQSQIEILRSNFEKSPPKNSKTEIASTKSRIPISTTMKTPPTSPERRDSRNFDSEQDKAILDLMSSSVHSTPMQKHQHQAKPGNKNVTVTSIRTNSKIPSGLPTLGSGRPPVPPKRFETTEGDSLVQVSTNGGSGNSFTHWVFNPNDSVTNIVVNQNKYDQK